jgi:hypothetical protein
MTKGWKAESARHALAQKGIETGQKSNIKTGKFGNAFLIGTETIEIPPMEDKEELKERIAYEKTLSETEDYRAFRANGRSHDEAIWATQKVLNIVPKPPYKDEAGNELKWFSISRLDPDLQAKAKKYLSEI